MARMIQMEVLSVSMEMDTTESESDVSDSELLTDSCRKSDRNWNSLIWREFFGR